MKNLLLIALVPVSLFSAGSDFCKKYPNEGVCKKSPLQSEIDSQIAPVKTIKLSPSTKKALADSFGLKDPKKIDAIVDAVMTVTSCTSDEEVDHNKTKRIIQNKIPNASKSQVNVIKEHIVNAQNTISSATFIEQNVLAIAKLTTASAESTNVNRTQRKS